MLRIGHRGAAGHAPENTLRSIRTALTLGAEVVEVDVQRTLDGELVLLHDKRVDRTTNGKGYIRDLSFHEARQLDAGGGEVIPTLREALDLVLGSAQLMIEIIDPRITPDVMRIVEERSSYGQVIVASFHHRALLELRQRRADARTLALFEGVPVNYIAFAKDAAVTHVGVSLDSLTDDYMAAIREAGYQLFVYTANDERDIRWLSESSVDGIISDYPERIPVL
jgi:glycerophosphoryl diester phosphodiesterase